MWEIEFHSEPCWHRRQHSCPCVQVSGAVLLALGIYMVTELGKVPLIHILHVESRFPLHTTARSSPPSVAAVSGDEMWARLFATDLCFGALFAIGALTLHTSLARALSITASRVSIMLVVQRHPLGRHPRNSESSRAEPIRLRVSCMCLCLCPCVQVSASWHCSSECSPAALLHSPRASSMLLYGCRYWLVSMISSRTSITFAGVRNGFVIGALYQHNISSFGFLFLPFDYCCCSYTYNFVRIVPVNECCTFSMPVAVACSWSFSWWCSSWRRCSRRFGSAWSPTKRTSTRTTRPKYARIRLVLCSQLLSLSLSLSLLHLLRRI